MGKWYCVIREQNLIALKAIYLTFSAKKSDPNPLIIDYISSEYLYDLASSP